MSFSYNNLKKSLSKKYSEKLPKPIIDDLLTFERGLLENAFPQKRLIIQRLRFNGVKNDQPFSFDRDFQEGINLILADNLRGKSSLFKIVKYALTGDDDLAKDIKSWLKNVYVQFSLKTEGGNQIITSVLNFDKARLQGFYYNLPIDELIDKEVDSRKLVFAAENEKTFKTYVQDFFFKEFDFYHLNWTQKSPVKDKNELIEAKASWNTYYESIYLASRNSDKLAYGSQEELIFQMLLGLKYTHSINRLKVKYEMITFELAKVKDAVRWDIEKNDTDNKALKKQFEKIEKEIEKLKSKELKDIDISAYFQERNNLTQQLNSRNVKVSELEDRRIQLTRTNANLRNSVDDIKGDIRGYQERLKKAQKSKLNLDEYLQFGIFFSNLEITVCPHCNASVKNGQTNKNETECYLCHEPGNIPQVDKAVYEVKIASLTAEIDGYQNQLSGLENRLLEAEKTKSSLKVDSRTIDDEVSALEKLNKDDYKRLKAIDDILNKAEQEVKVIDRLIDLQSRKAVLEFQLSEFETKSNTDFSSQVKELEAKLELLTEAMDALKEQRGLENQDILTNFKILLLEELRDLGITAITEVRLSETFRITYNQNSNWVNFDEISEGEQLRVKIAFYLSIIQCDIKFNAGRHPRLLIIDSPNKEEGDRTYRDGLKSLLKNVSDKFGEHMQIIIGTASRELEGSVPENKALVFPEGQFVF